VLGRQTSYDEAFLEEVEAFGEIALGVAKIGHDGPKAGDSADLADEEGEHGAVLDL
jgi:hypothetical protein